MSSKKLGPTPSTRSPGPWRVATLAVPAPAPEGLSPAQRARWDEVMAASHRPFRQNDGAFVVTGGDGDDRKPIATVAFQGHAKRGQAYSTPDPEGLANALAVAAAPDALDALREAVGLLDFVNPRASRLPDSWYEAASALLDRARAILARADG